jgi:predicted nucleotidyltransferase
LAAIVTLEERKAREADRLRKSALAAMDDLRRFASEQGGRFLIFGSAAKGNLKYDSDFDVLIDFPLEREASAWDWTEEVCRTHRLKADIHSVASAAATFVERVRREAIVLE